jgi:hypothetical protein
MKNIKFLLLTALIMAFICSCSQNPDINNMPLPFGENQAMGGDELSMYYEPGKIKIQSIPLEIVKLISDTTIDEWFNNNRLTENSEPSLMGHENLYSLLKAYKPNENIVREIFKERREKNLEYIDDDIYQDAINYNLITDEDLDVIFTYDEAKVNEHFASDYSIFYNGKLYSPQWIYTHSTEDYKTEGIPAELIRAKSEKYNLIPFTEEAQEALNEKLTAYSHKN